MLSTGEVAKRLNVSDRTVRNWIENGVLTGYRFGQSYRIDETDLDNFIEKSRVNSETETENNND